MSHFFPKMLHRYIMMTGPDLNEAVLGQRYSQWCLSVWRFVVRPQLLQTNAQMSSSKTLNPKLFPLLVRYINDTRKYRWYFTTEASDMNGWVWCESASVGQKDQKCKDRASHLKQKFLLPPFSVTSLKAWWETLHTHSTQHQTSVLQRIVIFPETL